MPHPAYPSQPPSPIVHSSRTISSSLRAYFNSGWAFFIPYLFVYIFYYWQRWPANPSAVALSPSGIFRPPALLHVYWALHVIHVIFAIVALRSWWRDVQRVKPKESPSPPSTALLSLLIADGITSPGRGQPSTGNCPPISLPSALRAVLRALGPWLFLTLLFAIPGVYLEWPSDPWEHLRRITEWNTHALIGSHSAGYKSFYFFAYSFVGWLPPAQLLSWLNVYYVGICLLLAWQYYLLAKAVGLDRRWAFLFVIVNALTFGNSCFAFYRYYGLSTSIYAQLGAVALTRIVLVWARGEKLTTTDNRPRTKRGPWGFTLLHAMPRDAASLWVCRLSLCALLLIFITFNHIQGLGIAGLSVAAIYIWRLIEWKRSALWWLLGIALALNFTTTSWYLRHPAIYSAFRAEGWMSAWYGFDLFSLSSPAAGRMMQILGVFGLTNVVAGIILIRRNNVVGWLTIGSVLALSLSFITLPAISFITATNNANIAIYQRILFAIPSGLAIVSLVKYKHNRLNKTLLHRTIHKLLRTNSTIQLSLLAIGITAAVALPPSNTYFGRLWHMLMRPPDDLAMRQVWRGIEIYAATHPTPSPSRIAAMSSAGFLIQIQNAGPALTSCRHYSNSGSSVAYDLHAADDLIHNANPYHPTDLLLFRPTSLTSFRSLAGVCSRHWPAQEASLVTAGTLELQTLGIESGMQPSQLPSRNIIFYSIH